MVSNSLNCKGNDWFILSETNIEHQTRNRNMITNLINQISKEKWMKLFNILDNVIPELRITYWLENLDDANGAEIFIINNFDNAKRMNPEMKTKDICQMIASHYLDLIAQEEQVSDKPQNPVFKVITESLKDKEDANEPPDEEDELSILREILLDENVTDKSSVLERRIGQRDTIYDNFISNFARNKSTENTVDEVIEELIWKGNDLLLKRNAL